MTDHTYKEKRTELVSVAEDAIAGKIPLINAVRRISQLRYDISEPDNPIFLPIVGVDSETHHFPIGTDRSRFGPELLAQNDTELEKYMSETKQDVLDCCQKIIQHFGVS